MNIKRKATIESLKYGPRGWIKLLNDRKARKEREKRAADAKKFKKLS